MDLPSTTAAVRAFSLTSRITQRDAVQGADAPGYCILLRSGSLDSTTRRRRDVRGAWPSAGVRPAG